MTSLDTAEIRGYLKEASFKSLFIEELGWNLHRGASLSVTVNDHTYELAPIAEKRGVQVFECPADASGALPDRSIRQKIEREVTKSAREHLIVFLGGDRREQLWQWVAREPGRPAALREQRYLRHQSGDALIQKLQHIAIPLDEEEAMSLTGVTQKLKDAFDKDKVTKKFYERFKTEHARFLKLIGGIDGAGDREWYASLMLNRLMFVYFIEKKGFLDGDSNYLRNRLARMQQKRKDKFHTFYRHFLLRLFHEGLGHQPPRSSELDELLGDVPYLNGGLFDVHELESENPNIEIPDRAFEALFDFFDAYEWHLDDRPLRTGKEINPDVLGYIFEKYVNQKQMGAYYTKEDITEYIAKNTVIPYLFDAAEKECAIAFQTNSAVWRLLRDDPDRYIHTAVRKGVDKPLPDEIAAGIDDVSKRTGWNRPADAEFALPTETWREHVARRQRCLELRAKLGAGEVTSINDLITYNLDIRQFAQDAIEQSEGPELVRAFFSAIESITVLDPAVGSGAFLFAALNILKPLYDASLDRMQAFIDDLSETGKDDPGRYADFRDVLARVEEHSNREYYVLKSIVINNLYGVDIIEEAVEICKLRLFLKLVAQLDRSEEIEPLPDMDFNIRAGNTLVGFTSLDAVRQAMTVTATGQCRMISAEQEAELAQIERNASFADRAFQEFHRMQRDPAIAEESFAAGKEQLRGWLKDLRDSLDRHLAREYGIDAESSEAFEPWRASHQPFHWFVEFYGIMKRGGFDAIIGNPPYVEYSKVRDTYTVRRFHSLRCGNLYTLFVESGISLAKHDGRIGLIVPLSLACTERMTEARDLLSARTTWLSCWDIRPTSLFTGVTQRLCIVLTSSQKAGVQTLTSGYRRWTAGERPTLMQTTIYTPCEMRDPRRAIPKVGSGVELTILSRLPQRTIDHWADKHAESLYVHRIVRYFIKATTFLPTFITNGKKGKSEDYKKFQFEEAERLAIAALLNSSLFYWFWRLHGDGYHCGYGDVYLMRYAPPSEQTREPLAVAQQQLMEELRSTSVMKEVKTKAGVVQYEEFRLRGAKPVLDSIDHLWGECFSLTDEELDFIINYDIKYRVGSEGGEDEG